MASLLFFEAASSFFKFSSEYSPGFMASAQIWRSIYEMRRSWSTRWPLLLIYFKTNLSEG